MPTNIPNVEKETTDSFILPFHEEKGETAAEKEGKGS